MTTRHDVTLRDFLAAHVISGWLASYAGADADPFERHHAERNARRAYLLADAMLDARKLPKRVKV
jgi:hypothetical protein